MPLRTRIAPVASILLWIFGSALVPCAASEPAAADPGANGTAVELTIVAGQGLNPNAQGRASPVVVRIFQLSAVKAFEAADFEALFEHPSESLRHEILTQEELVLRPGEIQQRTLSLPPQALTLGIAAAFRDLEHAVWHVNVPVRTGQRNFLLVDLDQDRIRIETGDENKR